MKYSKSDIAKDEVINEFFLAKDIRETTQNHYLQRLSYYCSFIGKLPNQMIEEAEFEEEERIRMRKRKIRQYFFSFLEFLQKNNYSRSTISSYFASIKAFYRFFEIEIPKLTIASDNNGKSQEKPPTREEIQKALPYANLKYRAIILIMASSGMGSAEVRNLKYGDFLNSIKEYLKPLSNELYDIPLITERLERIKNLIPIWDIKRYKTDYPYITFSTPESTEALLKYMNWRVKNGYPFNSLDDWIFITDKGKLQGQTLSKYFQRLNEKAGFGKKEHSVFFHSHALRIFFGTTMYRNGIQRLNYDYMMGHSIDQNASAYNKTNPETLKREYMRCIEDLSIETVKIRRIESNEIKNIVRELDKNKEQVADLSGKMKFYDELFNDDEFLKEWIKKKALKKE